MLFSKVFFSFSVFLTSASLSKARNGSGSPVAWHFNTTNPRGPDGPWFAIDVLVGWPPENVTVYPGRAQASLVVSKAVCEFQGSSCSNSDVGFYDRTAVKDLTSNQLDIHSDSIQTWNGNLTDPLRLSGSVTRIMERITVRLPNGTDQYLDNVTCLVDNGMTVSFAGNVHTSLDIGILSLAFRKTTETNQNSTTYHDASAETYTPLAFLSSHGDSDLPISISWGLHVGSARHNVSGSLHFGGYDQSRILETPGIFDSEAILLTNISINSTVAAFHSTSNLLNSSNTPSPNVAISVVPEPALPYLYLPPAICTSLASRLPLKFNSDLDLYTWDLSHPSLPILLSSLSNLRFTFTNTSNITTTIAIPLALLNLTLTPPLVKTPTPYFPCRPYTPVTGSAQYYLGRAFLQGAFIGQNWDTGSHFLAQAPGPSLPPLNTKIIGPNDTAISATVNSPAWEDTWKGILSRGDIEQTNSSLPTGSGPKSGSSLSRKAGIGIGIGCAIGGLTALSVATVWWVRRKKPQRGKRQDVALKDWQEPKQTITREAWMKSELGADASDVLGEMEGAGHYHEVQTNDRFEIEGVERMHLYEVQADHRSAI